MKYIKNNPFLTLSFTPLIAHFLFVAAMAITVQSQGVIGSIFSLEDLYFKVMATLTILALICIGIGFKKKEYKKGLWVSAIINIWFLIPAITNLVANLIAQNELSTMIGN